MDIATIVGLVLGVGLINGRGEIVNFGGQVMKNVAGYDLSRRCTATVEAAHDFARTFMNVRRGHAIIGSSTTALVNMLAGCYGQVLAPGSEIVLVMHHAGGGEDRATLRHSLTAEQIASLERQGEKSAENIVEALIAAAPDRVVIAMEDPNPLVAGRGIERLRENGIEVITDVLKDDAEQLNPGFIKRMRNGRPYVRGKLAMSMDGRTALASGERSGITSEAGGEIVNRRGRAVRPS